MIKYCWFWFCLPACRERVFDWLIKNENWWPEFILNRCWGLSKDLHNFHQHHLHGRLFHKISNIFLDLKSVGNYFNHHHFMCIHPKLWNAISNNYFPVFAVQPTPSFAQKLILLISFDKFHIKVHLQLFTMSSQK